MIIFQGDQYYIPIQVYRASEGSEAQEPEEAGGTIRKIEIIIANIRKEYSGDSEENKGILWYGSEDPTVEGKFGLSLSEAETLNLQPGNYETYGRVYYDDNTISGWKSLDEVTVVAINQAQVLTGGNT